MDLKDMVLTEHTVQGCDKIVRYIGKDTKRLDQLMELFLTAHKEGNNTFIRHSLRVLQLIDMPKKYHGKLMDACFNFIESNDAPAAIKAFSLTVLENLAKHYPDIAAELRLIIEERWEHETPAFKSRGRKILKTLK